MTKRVLAIIGTAGRNGACLTKEDFEKMCEIAAKFVVENNISQIVSGGAAWSDHVAVWLKQNIPKLELVLYTPAPWDAEKKRFARTNPGRITNRHHFVFSKALGRSTLDEIHNVRESLIDCHSFRSRNKRIAAAATLLIAFGITETPQPTTPGTLYTWKCASEAIRRYINVRKEF